MPKLSVIIPIYNGEQYLPQCLNSVINQTFKDIEIICVNDGSTDSTAQILEIYANKDSRIKIVTKENGGLSSARNEGFKYATSDIVHFLDADDWLYSENSYEELYHKFTKDNMDMLIFEHQEYDNTNNKIIEIDKRKYAFKFKPEDYEKVLNKSEFEKYIFHFTPFAWNKFYKKDFLTKNNIIFSTELKSGEDSPYALHTIICAENIMFTESKYIVYRVENLTSMTKNKIHEYPDFPIKVSEEIINILNNYNLYEKYRIQFIISSIYRLLQHYLNQTFAGNERETYRGLVLDFFMSLKVDKKTLKKIAKFDTRALEILHKELNYPIIVKYKLFNLIPIIKVRYKAGSKKYYFLGLPFLKIVKTGLYTKDIFIFGGFIKIIKSDTY